MPGVEGPACGAGEARADEGSEGAGEVSKRLFFRLFASVGTACRRLVLGASHINKLTKRQTM